MPAHRQSASAAVITTGMLVMMLLPVVYLLSIGPAYWLGFDILNWFYAPLIYLAERWDLFGELLLWYLKLFDQ